MKSFLKWVLGVCALIGAGIVIVNSFCWFFLFFDNPLNEDDEDLDF